MDRQAFAIRYHGCLIVELYNNNNDVRPHSSLDYRTPHEFRRHHESTHMGAILK